MKSSTETIIAEGIALILLVLYQAVITAMITLPLVFILARVFDVALTGTGVLWLIAAVFVVRMASKL